MLADMSDAGRPNEQRRGKKFKYGKCKDKDGISSKPLRAYNQPRHFW